MAMVMPRSLRTTAFYVVLLALILGAIRYKNDTLPRTSVNDQVGVWDTRTQDGSRYTIITRSNDTGGEYFKLQVVVRPAAKGFHRGQPGSMPHHIHKVTSERIEVVQGHMGLDLNGTKQSLAAGASVTVPPGVAHHLWNAGSEDLVFEVTGTPGSPDETAYEMLAGLGRQVKGGLSSINPLQLLLVFADAQMIITDVPRALWEHGVEKYLTQLARLLGFRSNYPQYLSKPGTPLPVGPPLPARQQPAPHSEQPTQQEEEATAPEAAAEAQQVQPEEGEAAQQAEESAEQAGEAGACTNADAAAEAGAEVQVEAVLGAGDEAAEEGQGAAEAAGEVQ